MKNNNSLLKVISYGPIFLISFLAIVITFYLSTEHKYHLSEEKSKIKTEFIESNKETIKVNIDNTVSKYIEKTFNNSKNQLKKDLKKRIETVHRTSMNIYNKNKNTLSKDEIVKHIKNSIETLRFDEDRGYFFIYDLDGTNILHPIKPEREGKNFFNAKDINGTLIVQESINIAKSKEKEGFQEWFFNKPGYLLKEYEKIGYIKKFEPYNWYIGTGIYLDDFETQVKKKILEHLGDIEYKDNKYIFVLDYDANILLSENKKINNISLREVDKISSISPKYNEFINSNEKSKFLEYKVKNNEGKEHLKISFIKKIETLNWVVGIGFDLDELNSFIEKEQEILEKDYNKHLNTLLIMSVLITCLLLIVSYYLSKYIEKIFINYENALIKKEKLKFEFMLQELRNILDNLPVLIMYKDTKNNILTVNKNTADSIGLSIEELTNVPTKKIFSHDYKKYYSDDLEIIESKKPKIGYIEKYKTKNGPKIIESSKIPLFDEKGDVENIIIFSIDITEREKFKIENEKKQELLFQQSKLATMGEMISNIAHQWKQPLSTISVAATGTKIQKEMGCLSEKELFSAMDAINNSSQYLSQTIEDFRNFFKPNRNSFDEFSIVNIVDKTVKLLHSKFMSQNIEIIKDIKDIQILSLENGLIQVLINILNNARDELIKKDYRRLIFINSYEKDDFLIIEIKDNAGGILDKNIEKIFDAYFTTKSDGEGTGIGLYMSKDIISKLLSGDIFVENETYIYENKEYTGAKFTIKIKIF